MKNWILRYWLQFAGLLFFIYVLLRASTIPLTYDEIWTIDSISDRRLSDIFTYTGLGSNSHLLNSLCIWFLQPLAPLLPASEPLLYRLPNVLAFLLYARFSIRLIRSLSGGPLQVMGFVLCFCNPFLLEFFSLARGYGMALAFSAASLYYLEKYASLPDILPSSSSRLHWRFGGHATLTLTFASLSVLANFTWLNFYLALLPVLVYLRWINTKTFSRTFWKNLVFPSLILALIILKPIVKLRQGDELWYGGQTGLVYDTFTSLFLGVMGFETPDRIAHIVLLAIALQLVLSMFILLRGRKQNILPVFQTSFFVLLVLFVLLCLSSILQNLLFRTPFLVERTALVFLLPLIWLVLTACGSVLDRRYGKVALSGLAILSLAALVNFIHLANVSHSYSWPFDSRTEEVMIHLNKLGEQRQDTIYLSNGWINNVSLRHAQRSNKYPWVELIPGDADSVRKAKTDYFYLYTNERQYAGYSSVNLLSDSLYRDTALYFPQQDLLLLKIPK